MQALIIVPHTLTVQAVEFQRRTVSSVSTGRSVLLLTCWCGKMRPTIFQKPASVPGSCLICYCWPSFSLGQHRVVATIALTVASECCPWRLLWSGEFSLYSNNLTARATEPINQVRFDEHQKRDDSEGSQERTNRDSSADPNGGGWCFEAPSAIWLWTGPVFWNR